MGIVRDLYYRIIGEGHVQTMLENGLTFGEGRQMNLHDKQSRARAKFVGKKVRPQFSEKRYATCTSVVAHGPPSGWTCVYQIFYGSRGSYFNVERFDEVEIKPEESTVTRA